MLRHLRSSGGLIIPLLISIGCGSKEDASPAAPGGVGGVSTGGQAMGGAGAAGSGGATTGGAPGTGAASGNGGVLGGSGGTGGAPMTGGGTGSGGTLGGSGGAAGGTAGAGGGSSGGTGGGDTTPVGRHGHLAVSGTHMVDEHGANVQLKGISSQWLNLEKDGYATSAEALIWMRDNWQITVFRAAMGAEEAGNEPGYTTNSTAQAEMQRQVELVINNAIAAGVYVIVDWHAHRALEQQSAAVAFFGDLAARYGQHPNLIFEPFNEPLRVDWASELKPYHEAVVAAIRDNDPDDQDNVVILGTPEWCQRPDHAASSPLDGTNLMYTVHFYSCTHNADSASPPPFGDGISHLQRAQDALSAGLPIFITEWGATEADGGVGGTEVCASEADGWHSFMDNNQIGWAAWKLDDCDTEDPPDTSCLLQRDAPLSGGWTDLLNGHGSYVVGKLQG